MTLWEYLWAWPTVTKWLYHLNGNSNDSSGNGLNWTWVWTEAYTSGKLWTCANFNWSSMIKTWNCTLNSWTSVTHFAWIKTSTNNKWYITSRDWYSNGNAFYMAIWEGTANKLSIFLTWTTNTWWQTSTSSINNWNRHLVWFTYDGANLKIYVDWRLETTNAQTGWIIATSRPLFIWWRTSNPWWTTMQYWFNGQIDEIVFEDVVWSPEKIKKYYTYTKWRFWIQ